MIMKEDYCSFEVSKLLKEKGFDEICSHEWGVPDIDKGYILQKFSIYNGQIKNSELIDDAYTAPTHQMAMKWLRKNHIIIVVQPEYFNSESECSYWGVDIWAYDNYKKLQGDFSTYEKAVEAALKYCLENLI